ncbi:MAG TPA: hypothetical protein VJ875_09600 [Pyrinomonadaceae bacterium]|nr:hypothetical protein [Pyrinomonadaceae bacterium]
MSRTADNSNSRSEFNRYVLPFLIVGLVALALSFLGALFRPQQFFQSYLFAYVFWIGLVVGSLAVLMMQYLTGGAWGIILRRVLESVTATMPLMILLFVPLLFGLHRLYIWTHSEVVATDPLLQHKKGFLNVPFFIVRAAVYFGCWILFALLLNRWSREQDRTSEPHLAWRLEHLSGPGLFVLAITLSLAMIDWVMSVEPRWYSTIYAVIYTAGDVLAALAFGIGIVLLLARSAPLVYIMKPKHWRDLGNMLLTFVMLWAYCAFSQYLLIWSGNLREEITWYLPRESGGWGWIALALILVHFFLPFLLLLSRQVKERRYLLFTVIISVLVLRFVDIYWFVAPAFSPFHFTVSWLDFLVPIGMGGLWLAYFTRQLTKWPLLPLNDPYAEEALNAEE